MVGKRVSGDLYVHRTAIKHLENEDGLLVTEYMKKLEANERKWNVVRLGNDNIAFLQYPLFYEQPFPVLTKSVRIDFFDERKVIRDFSKYSNPPILHRKELLLTNNDTKRPAFEELTKKLDNFGVFYDAHKIGFKDQWEDRLRQHGITITDHKIKQTKVGADTAVQRHRTALSRYQLSKPVQLLVHHNLLSKGKSFFDYGCGRGDDIETLIAEGIDAAGWDPYYNNEASKKNADIVNIGFVLNVIEGIDERKTALRNAWKLTKGVLSVAVMSPSSNAIENSRPFKDGFLTSRNTFQKYYSQEQLRDFIIEELNEEPIAAAPGIFFVFSDDVLKQEFQLRKFDRNANQIQTVKGQREHPNRKVSVSRLESSLPILEDLASEILMLGRPTHVDEISKEITEALKAQRVSYKNSQEYCLQNLIDPKQFERIASERRDDLILYFALELFNQRKPYSALPKRLQQDLRYFYGNYSNAQIEARKLLFSIGDTDLIQKAAEDSANEGLGYLLSENQLQFHQSILPQLPLILRCYVACATVLYGDIESADLIKIHIDTGKLTIQSFENFADPLPLLEKRIKIDMRSQRVRVFNYYDRSYLFMKSLFLPEEHEDFNRQSTFDAQVSKLEDFDFSGYGPDADFFDQTLKERKLKINGFSIIN